MPAPSLLPALSRTPLPSPSGSWAAEPAASSLQPGPLGRARPRLRGPVQAGADAEEGGRAGTDPPQPAGNPETPRHFRSSSPSASQTLPHPKPCLILNLAGSQTLLHSKSCRIPNLASSQTLPHPKPCCIPNLTASQPHPPSQTLPHPKPCRTPAPLPIPHGPACKQREHPIASAAGTPGWLALASPRQEPFLTQNTPSFT